MEIAPLGALDPEVGRDLRMLRDFFRARDRHMSVLFGRNLKRSPTRTELIRLVVLAFSENRILRVSSYVRLCRDYASSGTVRTELSVMEQSQLVILQRRGQSAIVHPTKKLIDFYNNQLPRLQEQFLAMMSDRQKAEHKGR